MTDDDHTVDADETTMETLRRLAADAKAATEVPEPADRTVQADDTTMDELRRFAEEARRQVTLAPAESFPPPDVPENHTVDADDAAMETLRHYANEAQGASTSRAEPPIGLPGLASVPENGPVSSPAVDLLPDLPPLPPEVPRVGAPPTDDTVARHEVHIDLVAPQPTGRLDPSAGGRWQPPPRMVMPTEPEKRTEVHHGPWKNIALGLAAVVAVLAALFVFGQFTSGGDDDTPDEGSVPTSLNGGSIEDDGGLDG